MSHFVKLSDNYNISNSNFCNFCLPQYSALQGEQLSIQWAKQSGLLPEGRASQDGAGLLIITQVGSDTD